MLKLNHWKLFSSQAAPVALAVVLATTIAIGPAFAQQAAKPQQAQQAQQSQGDPDVDLRAAASRDGEAIKNLVYSAEAPGVDAPGQRQTYELSLLDAVEMALQNNLNLQVARFGPQNSFQGINSARGQFDPNLSFTIPQSFSRGSSPTSNQTAGGDIITSQNFRGGFSWNEQLEWGTNYSLNWNGARNSNNNEFATFNPTLTSGLSGNISQDLLRGFGDVNRTNLRVSMNGYDQSLEQFRGTVQNTIAQVVNAYWQLRGQAAAVQVQEESLQLAEQQFERNQIQVEIGTLAPIETVQAETQVASTELSLIQTRNTYENLQDQLKELINFDAVVDDPFAYELVPTEEPEQDIAPINAADAISIALENDPTLASQRIGLRSAELNLAAAKNSMLPRLQVNGSFNLQGRSGTRIIRSGGIGGEEVEIISSGFGTALGQVFSGDFNTWSIGATISMPLNNHAAKANAARSQISQRQQLTQFEQRRQQVTYDVRQQVRNIENLVQQVETSTLRRELAERQLRAEERKFEVGTSTNFNVLTFQRDFSNAQLSELQAIVNLQNAIAQLELNKGTILQYFGVQIGDAGTGNQSPDPLPQPVAR